MNVALYEFTCALCEHTFNAPQLSDFDYGRFILRSPSNQNFFLDAIADNVFSELSLVIANHPLTAGLDKSTQASILHRIFGITCDQSTVNEPLMIGVLPNCPQCGSAELKQWKPSEPLKLIDLPEVTHEHWMKQNEHFKLQRIEGAINLALDSHRH